MKIPLAEFEQVITETIFKRGFSYFKNGAILDFTEISIGEYEAVVSGTEDYTVYLKIKNNTVINYTCDCPYDLGPICKHVVATIFYLQQDILDFDKKQTSKSRTQRTKSATQQIKELLKKIPHDTLIEFIEETSKNNKAFGATFLANFGHLSQDQSKTFYQKQIHNILKASKERDGWIAWSSMKYIVKTTEPFVANAEKYLESNDFENVFYISTALLEEFTKAFDFADDSNGDLGYFIDSAIDLLSKLVVKKLPKALKTEMFEYFISTFKKQLFSGWDWHLGILHLASGIVDNESEADSILNCLDTVQGNYGQERAQCFKLNLLRQFKSEKEVVIYIEKHISNPSIRNEEIAKAFENNDFERSIKLSKEGIQCDKKEKPGLVMDWYIWLLKIAEAQNDAPKIIEYARHLFISSYNPDNTFYQILKATIKPNYWHPFLEKLIIEITPTKTRWTYSEILRKIYIEEKWWDRLFAMVKLNTSLNNIEQNEIYLSKDYNEELLKLYSERIADYVEKYIGRNYYQTACRYLRRMKKLGGQNQVTILTENFKTKYPQRKALLDELSRV